jgi:hypothetical protein
MTNDTTALKSLGVPRTPGEWRRDREDDARLLAAIEELARGGGPISYTRARNLARLSTKRMRQSLARLICDGAVAEVRVRVPIGSGASRQVRGLRLLAGGGRREAS